MRKFEILCPIGCRSDEGLSAPLIRRLREAEWCDCTTIPLHTEGDASEMYRESFKIIEKHLSLCNYDLVIATGDRIEMEACSKCCFLHNIPIGHVGAGIITNCVTFDGILRHQITLMADLVFCEDVYSVYRTRMLWESIEKVDPCYNPYFTMENIEKEGIYEVGISHMDDLEIDESLVPDEPYSLVLINPTKEYEDLSEEYVLNDYEENIIIGSNPDPKPMIKYDENIKYRCDHGNIYDNLPRDQFLGLMKNCRRFITNSSSAYYEAPYFLKPEQIIQVGERNLNRSTPKKLKTGASQKIVDILRKYWEDKNESDL